MIESIVIWTGLFIVMLIVHMARRVWVPVSLLLVLAGLGLSLVPGWPRIELNPELVLNALLPLLVYTSAVAIPWHAFRRNLRPIGLLSVGLVLFTTFGVVMLAHFILPGMSWIAALVLGAIISPPDDVAGASVMARLPVPRRLVTILEGEGLLNDATALTLFRFGLLGMAGGSFSLWQMPSFLLITLIGGTAYGLVIGWLALKIRQRLRDTSLEITASLVTPFAAYLVPEHFGLSGIPAVVAAGLLVSAQSSRLIPAETRVQVHALWRIVSFWLNSILFLILGLQLEQVVNRVAGMPFSTLALYGVAFSLLVIVLRFVWVFAAAYFARLLVPSLNRRDPLPPLRHLFVIGYTGMRGATTLAAALAIPLTLPGGIAFPNRDLIIFIAFSVILMTLLGQGLGLPALLQRFGVSHDGVLEKQEEARQVMRTRAAVTEAGIARLIALRNRGQAPAELLDDLLQERQYYLNELRHHIGGNCNEELRLLARIDWEIHRDVLAAERQALLNLLHAGQISDEILLQVEHDLDLRELRLQAHAMPK